MAKAKNNDISRQLIKLRWNKRILWLAILFFVMVVFWILLSIFTTTKTSSITAEQRELAKSFVPRLESKVFDEIFTKRSFSNEELGAFPIYVFDNTDFEGGQSLIDITGLEQEEQLETEEIIETPVATESVTTEETIEASESGETL